jgi:hypothetical protein
MYRPDVQYDGAAGRLRKETGRPRKRRLRKNDWLNVAKVSVARIQIDHRRTGHKVLGSDDEIRTAVARQADQGRCSIRGISALCDAGGSSCEESLNLPDPFKSKKNFGGVFGSL